MRLGRRQSGRFCCSMYCFTMLSGVPQTDLAKYETVITVHYDAEARGPDAQGRAARTCTSPVNSGPTRGFRCGDLQGHQVCCDRRSPTVR